MKKTMKKFYSFLFAAVALVGFAACNSDSTEEPAPAQENVGKMEFTANVDEATKTTLDGVSVKWCDEDIIGVNDKSYTIKEGTNEGTTATLVGEPVEAPYVAVYPLSAFNSYNKEQEFINITLDANVAAGTFADGANIALAFSNDTNLSFKNLLSVLKFQVAAECETVTINSENPLVGTVNFNYECFYAGASTYETSIELTINGGFKTGTTYYTTIIPGIHKFTVLTDGKPSREAKAGTTLYRNQVVDLGTLPVEVPTYSVYVTPQPKSSAADWATVNVYAWNEAGWNNAAWPGTSVTENTEVINGYTYYKYTFPTKENDSEGMKVIVNNGTNQTDDITLGKLDKDYYVVYSVAMYEVYTEAPAAGTIPEYEAPATKNMLYMKDACGWSSDGAHIYAYLWTPNTWVKMTDANGDKIYECEIPEGSGIKNVIFVRKNKSDDTGSWNNVWNKTADLTLPTDGKNMFTMSSFSNGTWSTYTPAN